MQRATEQTSERLVPDWPGIVAFFEKEGDSKEKPFRVCIGSVQWLSFSDLP